MDTPMEEKRGTEIIPTPKLGIVKGIIIILFGMILCSFLGLSYTFDNNIGGAIWGWILLALCLWRGIVAIVKRKKKRVSHLNLGIWAVLLVGVFIFDVWAIGVNMQYQAIMDAIKQHAR